MVDVTSGRRLAGMAAPRRSHTLKFLLEHPEYIPDFEKEQNLSWTLEHPEICALVYARLTTSLPDRNPSVLFPSMEKAAFDRLWGLLAVEAEEWSCPPSPRAEPRSDSESEPEAGSALSRHGTLAVWEDADLLENAVLATPQKPRALCSTAKCLRCQLELLVGQCADDRTTGRVLATTLAAMQTTVDTALQEKLAFDLQGTILPECVPVLWWWRIADPAISSLPLLC
jgi:hypothetical protein